MRYVSLSRRDPDSCWAPTTVVVGGLALALLLLPGRVTGQEITREPDGLISVRATDVPLGRLLHKLGAVIPFGEIVLSPSVEDRPVTLTLERVGVRRAVAAALETAGVGYVLGETRLVAGDTSFRGSVPATAASKPMALDGPMDARPGSGKAEAVPDPDAFSPEETARFEAEARSRTIALEQALQPPPVPLAPGDHVMLPFPGPDGVTPLSIVKPAGPPSRALPFPPTPGPHPVQVVPPPTDPRLIELINALAPRRIPGK